MKARQCLAAVLSVLLLTTVTACNGGPASPSSEQRPTSEAATSTAASTTETTSGETGETEPSSEETSPTESESKPSRSPIKNPSTATTTTTTTQPPTTTTLPPTTTTALPSWQDTGGGPVSTRWWIGPLITVAALAAAGGAGLVLWKKGVFQRR